MFLKTYETYWFKLHSITTPIENAENNVFSICYWLEEGLRASSLWIKIETSVVKDRFIHEVAPHQFLVEGSAGCREFDPSNPSAIIVVCMDNLAWLLVITLEH